MTPPCLSCDHGRVQIDGRCPNCLGCGWSLCTSIHADEGLVQEEEPLWERDEGRFVEKRASYLHRVTGIKLKKAEALAYEELGYSAKGIVCNIDATAGTVDSWLEDLSNKRRFDAVLTKRSDELIIEAGFSSPEWPSMSVQCEEYGFELEPPVDPATGSDDFHPDTGGDC